MLEIIKELIYLEMSGNSILFNIKWIAFWPCFIIQLWILKRAYKSFFNEKKVIRKK